MVYSRPLFEPLTGIFENSSRTLSDLDTFHESNVKIFSPNTSFTSGSSNSRAVGRNFLSQPHRSNSSAPMEFRNLPLSLPLHLQAFGSPCVPFPHLPSPMPHRPPFGLPSLEYFSSIGVFDYTILEAQRIACFDVGGEKRLCLPQVLHLLPHFNINQINSVLEDLAIVCSRCSVEQLTILKEQGILPQNISSCGLITKSDAERLCKILLYKSVEKNYRGYSANSFHVCHNCFGKQRGVFIPELYTNSGAKSVECSDCAGLFTPDSFVGHSHHQLERRTCHWGFDSANWRNYLLLARDQDGCRTEDKRERLQQFFDTLKAKFSGKRKQEWNPDQQAFSLKRIKRELYPEVKGAETQTGIQQVAGSRHSTPALEDSERVVTRADAGRFERDFEPNIAVSSYPRARTHSNSACSEPGKPSVHNTRRPMVTSSAGSTTTQDTQPVRTTTDGDQKRGQVSPHSESSDCLSSQEAHLVSRLLSGQHYTPDERDSLLAEFTSLRQGYVNQIRVLTAEKQHLSESLSRLRNEHEQRIQLLETENARLKQEAAAQRDKHLRAMEEFKAEIENIRKQWVDTGTPSVNKIRAKYFAVKKELQTKSADCDDLRARYNTVNQTRLQLVQRLSTLGVEDAGTSSESRVTKDLSDPEPSVSDPPDVVDEKVPTQPASSLSLSPSSTTSVTSNSAVIASNVSKSVPEESPDSSALVSAPCKPSYEGELHLASSHHSHRRHHRSDKSKRKRKKKHRRRYAIGEPDTETMLQQDRDKGEDASPVVSTTTTVHVSGSSPPEEVTQDSSENPDDDLEPPSLERVVDAATT